MIPSVAAELERSGTVQWLSRTWPTLIGPSLGEIAMFGRGWRDDFHGDVLADQYNPQWNGAGSSVALLDGEHSGVVRCTAGVLDNNYGVVILGDVLGAFDTLDADLGWAMAWKMRANQTTNIQATAGVYGWNAAGPPFTYAGLRSDISANWIIRTTTASVAFSNIDTGVAADTAWHWHSLAAYDVVGTTTVGYWIDGRFLAEYSGANLSGAVMTPTLFCVNRGGSAAARTTDFDYWAVIPR